MKRTYNLFCRRMTMLVVIALTATLATYALTANAENQSWLNAKMSTMVRQLAEKAYSNSNYAPSLTNAKNDARLCAFVKTTSAGDSVLSANGCRVLAHIGDIYVADIPLHSLHKLVANYCVSRIEAQQGNSILLDSTVSLVKATEVRHASATLPRAFTGRGVVMGVMDVGFDLTHPTFLDASGNHTRIRRFWDQLSTDTIGSSMYVGADYTSEEAILDYAHSRDGFTIYHGTHTLGIAAGNGAGTQYIGMAPESDICLVSNAVGNDIEYIREEDLPRYTTATDFLGFKYIFDYAESVGKPCVISFSEGAPQDFAGDNQLYYEALSGLVGSGRIIVASAGNTGGMQNYVKKKAGEERAGVFMLSTDEKVSFVARSRDSYTLRTIIYNVGEGTHTTSKRFTLDNGKATALVPTTMLTSQPDSTLTDTIFINEDMYVQNLKARQSCFNDKDLIVEVEMSGPKAIGNRPEVSFEIVGTETEAEMFRIHGSMAKRRSVDPSISYCDETHGLQSPGSAPDVICVGSTNCRQSFVNVSGDTCTYDYGATAMRSSFSSIGPTFDGREKPDVMAPGANVVSSFSSYFLEHNPEHTADLVKTFQYAGREYAWSADTGTSMSAPVVGGIVALWLEANPKLTPNDVMNIIKRTSHPCGDYEADTPDYCGYGQIDAYAGLLDALGMSGISGVSHNNPQASIRLKGNVLNINLDTIIDHSWRIELYNAAGAKCYEQTLSGGQQTYNVDLGHMKKGVYAVQLTTGNKATTGSMLIRLQ